MKEISILFTRHERRIESQTIGFYDLKFSHKAIYFSLMSHDIQWIHKGSSCILLRSSMSKVSCPQIHNLTFSTIKSCLPNWSTMVSVTWLCSGLKATFLAASNLSNSIKLALQCKPSSVVSLKVRFQALYCSFCT